MLSPLQRDSSVQDPALPQRKISWENYGDFLGSFVAFISLFLQLQQIITVPAQYGIFWMPDSVGKGGSDTNLRRAVTPPMQDFTGKGSVTWNLQAFGLKQQGRKDNEWRSSFSGKPEHVDYSKCCHKSKHYIQYIERHPGSL